MSFVVTSRKKVWKPLVSNSVLYFIYHTCKFFKCKILVSKVISNYSRKNIGELHFTNELGTFCHHLIKYISNIKYE